MPWAAIGLGANLGPRRETLVWALGELARIPGSRVVACSSFYETEPVGAVEQPWFLNAVAALETSLTPRALLGLCLDIERRAGRVRETPQGPRTLDLDLLLVEDCIIDSECLTLPHPRLHLRRFVLVPLAEIAPERHHPLLRRSVTDLLADCPDTAFVHRAG